MKAYWDSSALVKAILDDQLHERLVREGGLTRTHTLAEVFSVLTGKAHIRMDAAAAAKVVKQIAECIQFVIFPAMK
ncbi:MAG TPA: hypothetical protein VH413_13975 [Verrucomicrobiae bacterium]|jgi:hypothetical protein|nr:hypothetical protein [Verrucomicrobiae bacterium]